MGQKVSQRLAEALFYESKFAYLCGILLNFQAESSRRELAMKPSLSPTKLLKEKSLTEKPMAPNR